MKCVMQWTAILILLVMSQYNSVCVCDNDIMILLMAINGYYSGNDQINIQYD